MRLSRVRIEGYRAIRLLDLELDELTAIIGENGFGKTSLLDALMTCLGAGVAAPEFAPSDFHTPPAPDPPADKIVIELTFIESRPDERAERGALQAALIGPSGAGVLVARVEARRPATGCAQGKVCFCDPEGIPLRPQPPSSTYGALRAACPAIVVRSGRYFVAPSRAVTGARPQPLVADASLEQQVLTAYAGLAAGGEVTPAVRAGFEAASKLVSQLADSMAQREETERNHQHHAQRTTRVLQSLAEAPGGRARLASDHAGTLPGGAAHGLAALLILGGVFRARADASSLGDADPILVLEDPEAYLHPLVAANVSRLIDALPVQRIVTTNSHDLLTSLPLRALRRVVRRPDGLNVFDVPRGALSIDELRRVGYHVRGNRADALFARCWLLVEGETEFWVVPELARILGVDLPSEGVRVVEFAQCGLEPLVKLAQSLGIGWTLLADGDDAGQRYADRARDLAGPAADERVILLEDLDLEHCLWAHGFDGVYLEAAGMPPLSKKRLPEHVHPRDRKSLTRRGPNPTKVILRAIAARSKPRLALEVLEAAAQRGPAGVPPSLRALVERSVRVARAAAGVP